MVGDREDGAIADELMAVIRDLIPEKLRKPMTFRSCFGGAAIWDIMVILSHAVVV